VGPVPDFGTLVGSPLMAAGHRHRGGRRRALVVAVATAGLSGCGGMPGAPAASTLPLTPDERVIASAAGGSQVDPAHDRNRYRYLAVSGPLLMPGSRLIASQIASMISRGWGQERSIGFRGAASVAQTVPVTAAGAEVLLNSPNHREFAAMSLLVDQAVAGAQTGRTPLWRNAAIAEALHNRRPVLWVVLGNGAHS
jgi:hypothetical protein